MTNEKYVEKEIYNDKGDEIGVMGIEEISSEPVYETPISGDFNLFAKTIPKGVNTTYKVKLQSVGVFFHPPLIVS